jgi:hypothetical protein
MEVQVRVDEIEATGGGATVGETRGDRPVHQRIAYFGRSPEGRIDGGNQVSGGRRVAARKQRHLMTAPNQLLGQQGDDPLGPSITCRRDRLERWSDLGNTHGTPPRREPSQPRHCDPPEIPLFTMVSGERHTVLE